MPKPNPESPLYFKYFTLLPVVRLHLPRAMRASSEGSEHLSNPTKTK